MSSFLYDIGVYGDGLYNGVSQVAEDVVVETGLIYTDTQAVPQWAKEAYGPAPAYPAQTRTYTAQNKVWQQTETKAGQDNLTGQGLASTQFSWTRTELHNTEV